MLYREFLKAEFKKRPSKIPATEYMKVVAKKWKKQKTKRGGDLQQGEVAPPTPPTTPVEITQPVPPTPVDYLPEPNYPSKPKGVWCFFHSEDLSPIEQHGGSAFIEKLKKFGQDVKKVGRLFKAQKRGPTDYPLASIKADEPAVPYLTMGTEKRKDGDYQVATISFYYKDNPSTAVGWQVRPRGSGFHQDDMEFVSIYYQNQEPVKVFFSQHSVGKGEGVFVPYDQCEFRDGYLVVYVARNSHANYPHAGTQIRVYGIANDITEATGPNRAYSFSEMTPSYNWNNGHGIKLYSGLRPAPPDKSISQVERILRIEDIKASLKK